MRKTTPQAPYSLKRLESYARWYYGRYFPSIESLREKLLQKCENNHTDVDSTLAKIREIFIEELLVDQRVRFLIDSHKNESFIRQNLKRKKFDEALIEQKLREYHDELFDWESHRQAIEKKIQELQNRGKSHKSIIQTLCLKFPHFKEKILLLENDSDDENLLKSYEKISKGIVPKNRNEQQKIAAKLMQRGFDYSDIKKLLF